MKMTPPPAAPNPHGIDPAYVVYLRSHLDEEAKAARRRARQAQAAAAQTPRLEGLAPAGASAPGALELEEPLPVLPLSELLARYPRARTWLKAEDAARRYPHLLPCFNLELQAHAPGSPLARSIGLCPVAGVSFEPARQNGVRYVENLLLGQEKTLMRLVPEPENPADPNALRVDAPSGEKLGFVPRQENANAVYLAAMARGELAGALIVQYRIDPKDDGPQPAFLLATGWTTP